MEIVKVEQAEMLEAINKSEVNVQISTAKAYPRDIPKALEQIKRLATIDRETAMECFYSLKRAGTDIDGLSVRFAEIVASTWGNLRVQARIIGNDGRFITAQGIAHDLESNVAVSVEVKRRITDKYGNTFSDDMQVVTGNAASSIAFRNAVLKIVPKAITKNIVKDIEEYLKGEVSSNFGQIKAKIIKYFNDKYKVSKEQIAEYLGLESIDNITEDDVIELRSLVNAIEEGSTTIEEAFKKDVKKTADIKGEEIMDKLKKMKDNAAKKDIQK